MNVLITGGLGLIGKALTTSLLKDGHQAWILSRNPSTPGILPGVKVVGWDGRSISGWGHLVGEMDAIVNLAGWSLAHWPWTNKNKRLFLESRVQPGQAVVQAIRNATNPPKVVVQASAIGYYGASKEPLDEGTPPGRDFGAGLCQQWEESTKPVEEVGVRRVIIRSAVVLSMKNVILQLMLLPARLFVGGRLGDGQQGFSWIHLDDEVAAIRFLLKDNQAQGIFNLSAPKPLSSTAFLQVIAKVLRKPFWFPVPASLLKLVLGEMSTLVLDGQYVYPKRLLERGFSFRFIDAEAALRDLVMK